MVDEPGRGDNRRGIERELKRGSLELIVLHLLAPGERYGYEIVTTLTEQTNGALEVTDGTLYPGLYRLERAGFVDVRWETPQRGARGDRRNAVPGPVSARARRVRGRAVGNAAAGRAAEVLPSDGSRPRRA